jgi:hypothetical protein
MLDFGGRIGLRRGRGLLGRLRERSAAARNEKERQPA